MAGVGGDQKGKKEDNGIGGAIDFVLSNAKLVLGVGGAAMLGIAMMSVKRMYDRALSAPTSPTKMDQSGKRSWEEPSWLGSSPRLLNSDMKSTVSQSLQTLPTSSRAFEPDYRRRQPAGGSAPMQAALHHTRMRLSSPARSRPPHTGDVPQRQSVRQPAGASWGGAGGGRGPGGGMPGGVGHPVGGCQGGSGSQQGYAQGIGHPAGGHGGGP